MAGKEEKTWRRAVKKAFQNFIPARRHGRTHPARCGESQEVWMAHNIWKDLNFEIGWLLNCCNHGFSGFLVPQRREMKNNISQSLDLESFLFLQEEREKKIFRLSRFNSYLAFFFFSVLRPVSHLPPFSLWHTLEAKVPLSIVKTSAGWKAYVKISLEEPYFMFWQKWKSPLAQKQQWWGPR